MIYALISGASFGAMAIFARAAYASGIDTATLLFLRFAIAAVCLGLVMLVRRVPLPRGRYLVAPILMGAAGYALQSFCFFSALRYASAGLVALLLYLYPAMVTILAALFLNEKMTRAKLIALLLALTGSVLTIGPAGDAKPLGIVFGVAAAMIYAVYITVGTRVLKHVSPLQSSTVVAASAAVALGIAAMSTGPVLPMTVQGWTAVIAIALISTVVAVLTFFAGIARVGPVNASTLSTVEPIVTLILAWLFLGEAVTPIRFAGGAMILFAVVLLARSGRVKA